MRHGAVIFRLTVPVDDEHQMDVIHVQLAASRKTLDFQYLSDFLALAKRHTLVYKF